jgi:hypothetical protein
MPLKHLAAVLCGTLAGYTFPAVINLSARMRMITVADKGKRIVE